MDSWIFILFFGLWSDNSLFYCSSCSNFGRWEFFQLAPVSADKPPLLCFMFEHFLLSSFTCILYLFKSVHSSWMFCLLFLSLFVCFCYCCFYISIWEVSTYHLQAHQCFPHSVFWPLKFPSLSLNYPCVLECSLLRALMLIIVILNSPSSWVWFSCLVCLFRLILLGFWHASKAECVVSIR